MSHMNQGNGNGNGSRIGFAWAPEADDALTKDARGPLLRRPISWRGFVRHKWYALGLFLVLAIPAAAAAWLVTKPVYRARATVEVSPMIPRIVYDTEQSGIIPLYEQYLNDQVMVLRSPTVLERVLDNEDVQRTAWYAREPKPILGSPPSNLERLRDELNAEVRPGTSFVDVQLTGPDATDATLIVNIVVDEYLKFINEKAQRFDDDVYQVLSEEYNALRATIDGLKSVVAELRSDLLTANPEELQAQQRQRLDAQLAALEQSHRAVELAEWQYKHLQSLVPQNTSDAVPKDGDIPFAMDPEWRQYFMQLKAAEHEVNTQSANLGENNYELARLRQAVEHARQRLDIREQQLSEIYGNNPAALLSAEPSGMTLEQQLAAQERRVKQLKFEEQLQTEAVQRERDRLEKTASSAEMLAKELDKLRHAEQRFEDVRQRKVAMEIERRAPASIRIQDRAYVPSHANNVKRRWMLLALAVVGMAGTAGGLTLLRATHNPAVETAEELTPSAAPFLGQVLWTDRRTPSPHDVAVRAECIRMVRTSLLQRLGDSAGPAGKERGMHRGHALQVTGASAGSGKTTATLMLGDSLGHYGKRVLIVDADLRRPTLHTRTGNDIAPGLVDVLQGKIPASRAIRPWPDNPQVHVLPSGDIAEADDELFSGPVLSECLSDWRQHFDLILFDGPPLLPVADARILAARMDSNILVIREGHCLRTDIGEAMTGLSDAGGELMGIIFFAHRGSRGYYRRGYGYSYGPGSSRRKDKALAARKG